MRFALIVAAAFILAIGSGVAQQRQQAPPRKPMPELQPPSPSAAQAQQPNQGERGAAQQPSYTEQRGTEDRPVVVKVLPAEKNEAQRAQESQDRLDKSSADWWMVRLTAAVAFVGALQVAALIGQATVFRIQAKALRDSVDLTRKVANRQEKDMAASITEASRAAAAMEEANRLGRENLTTERRAWIGVSGKVRFVSPSAFSPEGGRIDIDFAFKNFGNAPATSVRLETNCFFRLRGDDLAQRWDEFVAMVRRRDLPIGLALFPGDLMEVRREQRFDRDAMQTAIEGHLGAQFGRRDRVSLAFFGAAAYKIVGDPVTHVTCRAYGHHDLPLEPIADELALAPLQFLPAVID